jgi:hypothetical protein
MNYAKHSILTLVFLFFAIVAFGQGKSISRVKKDKTPYITMDRDTIQVKDEILLLQGSGTNGQFLYVQMLNGFNEPVAPADSRSASQRQNVRFFKEQNGVIYLFTKFYVINIESALNKNEIRLSRR